MPGEPRFGQNLEPMLAASERVSVIDRFEVAGMSGADGWPNSGRGEGQPLQVTEFGSGIMASFATRTGCLLSNSHLAS